MSRIVLAFFLVSALCAVSAMEPSVMEVNMQMCSSMTHCNDGYMCCSATTCCPTSTMCCGGGRYCCSAANQMMALAVPSFVSSMMQHMA